MLHFISFGSGSSGNCYYLFTDNDGLIIDLGVGVRMLRKQFADYALPMNKIHNIILTHDHADHVKSVGSFSSDYHVPVHATSLTFDGIRLNYCIKRKVEQINCHVLQKNVTVQIGDFEVTPFNVPHDSRDCVGYQICCEGIVFCLLTDVGTITDEIRSYISKANYLVIEANYDRDMLLNGRYPQRLKDRITSGTGHTSNAICADTIAENMTDQLRHVWLCHLSEENNDPELAFKVVSERLKRSGRVLSVTAMKRFTSAVTSNQRINIFPKNSAKRPLTLTLMAGVSDETVIIQRITKSQAENF